MQSQRGFSLRIRREVLGKRTAYHGSLTSSRPLGVPAVVGL